MARNFCVTQFELVDKYSGRGEVLSMSPINHLTTSILSLSPRLEEHAALSEYGATGPRGRGG